jgi:hypothetical protein
VSDKEADQQAPAEATRDFARGFLAGMRQSAKRLDRWATLVPTKEGSQAMFLAAQVLRELADERDS